MSALTFTKAGRMQLESSCKRYFVRGSRSVPGLRYIAYFIADGTRELLAVKPREELAIAACERHAAIHHHQPNGE